MHTLIITIAGFLLLGLFLGFAAWRKTGRATAARWFIPAWLLISAVHLGIGVFVAGYSFASELGVHTIVFGAPALAAWLLARRFKPVA
jgi:hypothetical protein